MPFDFLSAHLKGAGERRRHRHARVVKRVLYLLFATFLLMSMATVFVNPVAAAEETVYIRADGSIDPATSAILENDDIYTFTDNINGALVVEADNIVIDGAGHTLQGSGGNVTSSGISLNGRNNVTIKNLKITGFFIGISLSGSLNNYISDNDITNNSLFGVSIGWFSSENTIFNNTIVNNAAEGITLSDSANNNIVDGNTIANNSNFGLTLSNSANNNIHANKIANNTLAGVFLLDSSKNNTVDDNNVTNNEGFGIELSNLSHNTIARNTLSNNTWAISLFESSNSILLGNNITDGVCGISLYNSSSNTILENSIANNNATGAVFSGSSNSNTVQDNNITNNGESGVQLDDSYGNNITANTLTNNSFCGVTLSAASFNTLSGNNITNNHDSGILLLNSSDNLISRNKIAINELWGIFLQESSNNTFRSNDVSDNRYDFYIYVSEFAHYIQDMDDSNTVNGKPVYYWVNEQNMAVPLDAGYVVLVNCSNITVENLEISNHNQGLILAYTTGSTIINNNIANNEWGIELDYSSGNTIFHNTFTNNTQQVYSLNSTNVWDDGYPSGGNTWSDYYGTDSDGDGIGDIPYIIDSSNQDRYPLWAIGSTTPVANAGPDLTVDEDTQVTFDGSASTDDLEITSYTWTFTDGTPKTLTGVNPTYVFANSGTYTVTLNITDADGNWDTDTVVITVSRVTQPSDTSTSGTTTSGNGSPAPKKDTTKPVADAGPDKVVVEDTLVSFDAGNSSDNVGIASYDWDFGDNTTGTGMNLTHTYAEPGNYTVTLTITDAAGNSENSLILVTVQKDTDGDGDPDVTDPDNDNNGIPDAQETSNRQGVLENQPQQLYVVAVAVGGVAAATAVALVNLGGAAKGFDSAISKMPLPDKIKEFLQLYGEKTFETADKAKLEALENAAVVNRSEIVAFSAAAALAIIVFATAEANGLPNLLTTSGIVNVLPAALVSVCILIVVGEIFEAVCARACNVYRQFRLWMYGTIVFLISGLVFQMPFGSPGITRYKSGDISDKTKGLLVLSKMLMLLALTMPFAGLSIIGFEYIGNIGLELTLMTVCFTFIPLKPLAGKALFDYRKDISLVALIATGILFFACAINLLPQITYLATGAASACLVAVTLIQLRKSKPKK